MPEPAPTVIPVLRYSDARRAVDWLSEAFGFAQHEVSAQAARFGESAHSARDSRAASCHTVAVFTRRSTRILDDIHEEVRLSREQQADLRLFIRDITTRSEKFFAGLHEDQLRMRARLDDLGARLDDMGADIRANTQATLSVLDRMNENWGPPSGPASA